MANAMRNERARLAACLKKLGSLKISDLVRDDLAKDSLSFRPGLPYIEKTLGLFRDVARGGVSNVSSEYVEIVADHAEHALARFDKMKNFDVTKGNPQHVRNEILAALRDSYRAAHDDLSRIITRLPAKHGHVSKPPQYAGLPLAVSMIAVLAAGLAVTYHYGMLTYAVQNLLDQLRAIRMQ